MRLTRKTFMTTDKTGCEFECNMWKTTHYATGGKLIDERIYEGMGKTATTLEDLKEQVASKE